MEAAYVEDLPNIVRGTQYNFAFTIYLNDSLLNLTDYTATFLIKESSDSDTALITLTSDSGLTLGGTAGTIEVTISAADTSIIDVGTAYFTLTLTTDSTPKRYLEGPIKIRR